MSATKIKNQVGIPQEDVCWLEAGSVHLGPVISDIYIGESKSFKALDQREFLEKHDRKNRCLWFLWKREITSTPNKKEGQCGCIGGCNFFGKNVNGPNFFKVQKLDAGLQENEGKLFGSPDGWQNSDLDDHGDAFIDDEDGNRDVERQNSWRAGRNTSRFRFGNLTCKDTGKYRLRSDTNPSSYSMFNESRQSSTKSHMQVYGGFSRQLKDKGMTSFHLLM